MTLAIAMALNPVVSSFPSESAQYKVKREECKYDDNYSDDNKKACEKNISNYRDGKGFEIIGNESSIE